MAKIKSNDTNELGLTKSDMRFWAITLVLVAALLAAGWISTLVRWF